MSKSEAGQRQWRFYVDDMEEFSNRVLAYTMGLSQAAFAGNQLIQDAALRNLELIGEAATKVPARVRNQYPEIPWRKIIATRNRLIHGYLGIDEDTVWSIIRDDVPELVKQLRALKASL